MRLDRANLGPSGGMVDVPARTPTGYGALLKNAFYRAGSWVWRGAAQKLHATAYTDVLAGAWTFRTTGPGTPVWTVLGATRGTSTTRAHFVKLVGSALVMVPYNGTTGPDYDATDAWRAWRWAQVSDVKAYACRRTYKGGVLYNVQAATVTEAAVTAPPAPAVVDSAGAGALPAGNYVCAYRFRTADGMFSPWSPTVTAAIGAAKKRAWTIATSSHPRVGSRELWVSYPGQTDLFKAYTVADNTTTTVEEDVLTAAYGATVADLGLGLPPDNPEDVLVWGGLLWVVSNDPSPALWRCAVDQTAVWELFDPQKVLIPGSGASERAVAVRAFDDDNMALLMESSTYRVENLGRANFVLREIEGSTGCVSAAACDGGAGVVAWYDGHQFMASEGGAPAQNVARGWVEKMLARVPEAYADRAIVKYAPEDGGGFHLCVPLDAATEPYVDLVWRPQDNTWHTREYLGGGIAPSFLGRSAGQDAGQYTLACFHTTNRIMRVDAAARRDEGPLNIPVRIQTGNVQLPEGAGSVKVSRVHVGVRRRVDMNLPDPGATVSASVFLSYNDGAATSTPVTATLTAGTQYFHVKTSQSDPRARVAVVIDFDHPDALEVFDVQAEVVYYEREEVRT